METLTAEFTCFIRESGTFLILCCWFQNVWNIWKRFGATTEETEVVSSVGFFFVCFFFKQFQKPELINPKHTPKLTACAFYILRNTHFEVSYMLSCWYAVVDSGFWGAKGRRIKGQHMYPSRKSTSHLINNISCKKCDLLFSSNLVHRAPAIYIYVIYFYFSFRGHNFQTYEKSLHILGDN